LHNPDLRGTSSLKKIFFFILLLTSVFITFNPVYSSVKNEIEYTDEYSPENISSFIKHLIKNGEYYRAHSELGRLTGYYPGYISPLCYAVTDSYILYKSGRYSDVYNKEIISEDKNLLCVINVFKADSLINSGIYNKVLLTALSINQCNDNFYELYYKKRKVYYSILSGFNDGFPPGVVKDTKYRDSYEYAIHLSEERKSPLLGAVSGIIPGMGYVYAGEPGTGIVALIAITAGSAVTWGAHVNNIEPLAAVSGAATFFMYAGSIAGGYMQTVKYNRGLSEKLVVRLDRDFMLDKDRDDLYIKFGIESNVR